MKKIIVLLWVFAWGSTPAQEMKKAMEDRAREMHRVIGLDDREAWKKFIRENYSKALIDKPMQAKRTTSEGGGGTATHEGNIEGKARMFEMLHKDFGGGTISSLTVNGTEAKMVINGSGLTGTFTLRFTPDKPWFIDAIGVEAGN